MTSLLEDPVVDAASTLADIDPDPLAHIKVGDYIPESERYARDYEERRCGDRLPDVGGCDRKAHPEWWGHLRTENAGWGSVTSRWGGGQPPVAASPDTVEDPEEVKVEEINTGDLLRYRNKRDLLLVLGQPKKHSDKVEVLDLTHQRMRVIAKSRLVPRKETDPQPTAEQMAWVARFLADREKAVLEIGKREIASGRWTHAEMQSSLRKANIATPPPSWTARMDCSLVVELPKHTGHNQPSASQISVALTKALKEITTEDVKVTAVNGQYVHTVRQS